MCTDMCCFPVRFFHCRSGFSDLSITYSSPRGDDLDTRLLRANVLKGVLEGTTTSTVNLVNADLLVSHGACMQARIDCLVLGREALAFVLGRGAKT